MNTRKILFALIAVTALFFTSCEKSNIDTAKDKSIVPDKFKIDIPSSISNDYTKSSPLKSAQVQENNGDSLNGNRIYMNLNTFVAVGELAADMVQEIMWAIRAYNIEQVIDLTYISEDDGKEKHLVVVENSEYNGKTYEYQLTITDVESEQNEDGGIALQVFWNNSPVEGIAMIKPKNANNNEYRIREAMISVEYSEAGMDEYESYMIVGISGLPLINNRIHRFDMNNLKMFVGKKGDIIDVYGNSNHPNAFFYTQNAGFSWAFVASGSQSEDIAVAEVGLPSCLLDETNRNVLLKEYSVKNVLTNQINDWFYLTFGLHPDSAELASYLGNADAPGYFNNNGFIQGGEAPDNSYATYEQRILNLTPYNPADIYSYKINFKQR